MTKKMKRDKKPVAVSDDVADGMDVRLAYRNLIDSFAADQQVLEDKITAARQDSTPKIPD